MIAGVSDDAVYEMLWDCKFCGQKKLLGLTHRFCAGCGAPQDPSRRYFPPENEKVAVKDHVFVGADVTCPACRQPMSRAAKCCTNCGGPIDRGAAVGLVAAPGAPPSPGAPGYPPGSPGAAPYAAPAGAAYGSGPYGGPQPGSPFVAGSANGPGFGAPAFGAAQPQAKGGSKAIYWVLGIGGGLLVFLFGLILVAAFWTREGNFEVRGHSWERTIAVERYENVRKTAWCDGIPIGGREISRRREQRSTKQIPDGQTCETKKKDNGDGTYRQTKECKTKYREEPVMDYRCDFEITEWRPSRTLAARGASPKDPPAWPASDLRAGTCIGCEREGTRSEKYTVLFHDTKAGKDASCALPEAKWKTFEKGSKWKGQVGVLTDAVECDGLVRH